MPPKEFDPIEEAEMFLQEDIAGFEKLVIAAKVDKSTKSYVAAAIKAKELSDLFYEAVEGPSDKFVHYKSQAAAFYLKMAKDPIYINAALMAILMNLQAGLLDKAQSLLTKWSKKAEKSKGKSKSGEMKLDEAVVKLCGDILKGDVAKVASKFDKGGYVVDEYLESDVKLALRYLTENSESAKK